MFQVEEFVWKLIFLYAIFYFLTENRKKGKPDVFRKMKKKVFDFIAFFNVVTFKF